MKTTKLNIRFIIAHKKLRGDDKAPILLRITNLSKRKQLSSGLFINPSYWNSKQQLVEPPEPDVDHSFQIYYEAYTYHDYFSI